MHFYKVTQFLFINKNTATYINKITTAQKMKFTIKNFFSKCHIYGRKSLIENAIFRTVRVIGRTMNWNKL